VPASDEAVAAAVEAAAAAADRMATDPVLLEVADVLVVADLFLVVTAGNERQLGAVVDAIDQRLHTADRDVLRREGVPSSGWVLLDYGDLVCHVMLPETRERYALERIWADVPQRNPASGARLESAGR
jgi:ribosome silencing factor RsfS/YbeB/iojap